MSDAVKAAVGLRVPERRQMVMVMRCRDDLVGPTQPVRTIMAVVERLKVSRFLRVDQGAGRGRRTRRDGSALAEGLVAVRVGARVAWRCQARRRASCCRKSSPGGWIRRLGRSVAFARTESRA